jgi:3-deoxy-7-phosphoheptulonate synthase
MPYKGSSAREEARGTYSGSARFGRIGERTRRQDGTHVGLAQTVHNPIGVKLGPAMPPEDTVARSRTLNPVDIPATVRDGPAQDQHSMPGHVRLLAQPPTGAATRAGGRCPPYGGIAAG